MFVFLMFFGGLAFCTCYTLKNKQMEPINVCFSYVFFWRTGFLHLVRLNVRLLVWCFTSEMEQRPSSQKRTYIHMTSKKYSRINHTIMCTSNTCIIVVTSYLLILLSHYTVIKIILKILIDDFSPALYMYRISRNFSESKI